MKVTVITLFPSMFRGFLEDSIVKRAVEKGLLTIEYINPRESAQDVHGTIDDRPFGGGAGMVMMAEPIIAAITKAKKDDTSANTTKTILMSPRGALFTQEKAQELSRKEHIVLVAGHYEGIDERIMGHIDEEISIGDYVLTGGELPAAVIIDAIARLIPDVLKKSEATEEESFFTVPLEELISAVGKTEILEQLAEKGITHVKLLEYPQYTRPRELNGEVVPEPLLSGDPKKIRIWQLQEAYKKTLQSRPDLI